MRECFKCTVGPGSPLGCLFSVSSECTCNARRTLIAVNHPQCVPSFEPAWAHSTYSRVFDLSNLQNLCPALGTVVKCPDSVAAHIRALTVCDGYKCDQYVCCLGTYNSTRLRHFDDRTCSLREDMDGSIA